MTIEQIVGLLGQVATWVTVLLVFLTLREMEKQRKSSQKPELIIPYMPVWGYTDNNEIFIASKWTNKEIKDVGIEVGKQPHFNIYNIGTGAAKEISLKWDFDLEENLRLIQDYCYHNSIPLVVSLQNDYLKVDINQGGVYINVKASLNNNHTYLMPASVTSQGLRAELPFAFLELISILIFLDMHQTQKRSKENGLATGTEVKFDFPVLSCKLEYADIGGERYKKKFEINFKPFILRYPMPKNDYEPSINTSVFHGIFEFTEIK